MSENQKQVRTSLKRASDLTSQVAQFVLPYCIRLCFIRD